MSLRKWFLAALRPSMSLRLRAYKAYYFTERELRWALRHVRPGDLVIDIGSNVGVYTFWLAKRVRAAGAVVALDPVESCVQYLGRAVSQLGWSHVKVLHCGASDRTTTLELHIPLETGLPTSPKATFRPLTGPAQTVAVKVWRLDELMADRDRPVSFVKCDTEGHELKVLQGAEAILVKDRPALLLECEQRYLSFDMRETFAYLVRLGYGGWFLSPSGSPQSVQDFSPETHQLPHVADPTSRSYINNFLFLPLAGSSGKPSLPVPAR